MKLTKKIFVLFAVVMLMSTSVVTVALAASGKLTAAPGKNAIGSSHTYNGSVTAIVQIESMASTATARLAGKRSTTGQWQLLDDLWIGKAAGGPRGTIKYSGSGYTEFRFELYGWKENGNNAVVQFIY